ncbi:InlB B-repeat-containing protein, partial [Candidatus Collinsella stercoripullorum]|uniref:InlB B-repeat-containing protein n=1 Tax=Candidatus Collinsella stercoripullorum TaxID=2838522 RepID=UPI0022E76A63
MFYTVDGADTDVAADESGTYTIPAEAVNDGLAITVETAEIPAADEPAADDAAGEADGVATLTINVENSSVTLTNAEGEEQTLTESQDVQVAEGKDLSLTVQPDDGYKIEDVVVSDGESELAVSGEDDSYAVPSDSVSDGTSIQVNVLAASARANVKELKVGETMRVSCNRGGFRHSHSWRSSDTAVATVTNNSGWLGAISNTQTVAAVGPGEATIRCDNEEILTVHVTVSQAIVYFEPNGGDGESFELPTTTYEDGSYKLSLPTLEDSGFKRDGYTFVGWSTDPSGTGENYTPQQISVSDGQTFYAIWAENNPGQSFYAEFYIRTDGKMPYEPNSGIGAGGVGYLPAGGCDSSYQLEGTVKQAVAINNNNELVAANIGDQPSPDEISEAVRIWNSDPLNADVSYDPTTQKVVWYVIKEYDGHYHVDGVIVGKESHVVTYEPNGGGAPVPDRTSHLEGDTVEVNFAETPNRAGYTFLGWDTDPNAVTPEYTEDGTNTFSMPGDNVTLYAIWRANDSTMYKVQHYTVNAEGVADLAMEETFYGETDSVVTANAISIDGYTYVEDYSDENGNVEIKSGTIKGDNSLVLRLYYTPKSDAGY